MRTTRSFRLTLSATGMDLLIDVHCHMIRATRCLLSWGASLHIAVCHLDTLPAARVAARLAQVAGSGLPGSEIHYLGAPSVLAETAAAIMKRTTDHPTQSPTPLLGDLYIVALQEAAIASAEVLYEVHATMLARSVSKAKFRS